MTAEKLLFNFESVCRFAADEECLDGLQRILIQKCQRLNQHTLTYHVSLCRRRSAADDIEPGRHRTTPLFSFPVWKYSDI